MGGFWGFAILIVIGIAIFVFYKKRKADKEANPFLSNRKNKDEVWKTIKQFLKDNDEKGKELVDSYVLKRSHIDAIDQNGSLFYRKNKTYELKIRKMMLDQAKAKAKANGTKAPKQPPVRDLFVVVFTTRDTKTGKLDPTRCFECEVVNKRIGKNQYDRKILINGQCDYEKEMEWIAPIRAAELAKSRAIDEKIAKQKAQQAKVEMKKRLAKERKAQKHANKTDKK